MPDRSTGRPQYRHLTESEYAAFGDDLDKRWRGAPYLTREEKRFLDEMDPDDILNAARRLLPLPGVLGLIGIGYEDRRRRKREHKRRAGLPRPHDRVMAVLHRAAYRIADAKRPGRADRDRAALALLRSLGAWKHERQPSDATVKRWRRDVWHEHHLEVCDFLLLMAHRSTSHHVIL